MGSVEETSRLLSEWEEADNAGNDVTPILTKLAEVFELETEAFLKQDPDPFDDRHPSRSQPDCTLGHILKAVFRNQRIVDEMVKVYCLRDVVELNTVVCRFLLALLPGLESVIFQEEPFVLRLFEWAENDPNPLQSYATGLLAAAMDVPEIASSYREKNANLVPIMLKRLYELSKGFLQDLSDEDQMNSSFTMGVYDHLEDKMGNGASEDLNRSHKKISRKKRENSKVRYSPMFSETKSKEKKQCLKVTPVEDGILNEGSNSNWAEFMVGSYQVYPLTSATQQKHIIQYLTPLGEYQELIGHVFEENALDLILRYIDFRQNRDVRLVFEALKYLASLFCHKKIAIEFINTGGLHLLLKVKRPSIAATGVSICLYYLGYLEEAMEKICMLPSFVISDLVSYALWLLECSHNSSRCHSTLFFGFAFTFKVVLKHFDQQDGLRKLFNVMSTLDIFVSQNARTLSDDDIFANRLTTKHVCGSLKRYFEAHLAALVEEKRIMCKTDSDLRLDFKASRAESLTPEAVERNMEILHELSLTPLTQWKPVNEFVNLDGVTFLIELITSYFESSYSGRVETVKNALDVLKICALTVSTQLKLCEKITNPDYLNVSGISVLLQAAEGELMPVAEVQHSALLAIVNCVCTKIPVEQNQRNNTTPKRKSSRQVEELLNKIWKTVRIKNGIIVLINLLTIKSPLTNADSIRSVACKALCGLARSETVKQIISKLPLVTSGQLIDLMKEPVLQDKLADHVQFCKYGVELIERVTGAPLAISSQSSMNFNKLCVSEVVSKTKVVYDENQLVQLIIDHLVIKDYPKTAACLQKEMEEKSVAVKSPICLEPFPSITNISWQTPAKSFHGTEITNKYTSTPSTSSGSVSSIPPVSVPLKLVLNKKVQTPDVKPPQCRLQKPQTCSGSFVQSPAFQKMKRQNAAAQKEVQPTITLDSIVTEYLRKQHSMCPNPMLACPPFDLFVPHKCPEPHFERNAPVNVVLRLHKQEMNFQNGGYRGAALNAKYIYSRFRLHRTCRDEEGRCDFTTCAFYNNHNEPYPKLLVGTVNGKVHVFNANTAKQVLTKDCRFRGISHIESKESTAMVITSDGGRVGNSSIWKFNSDMNVIKNFPEVSHMEFAKRSLDRVIATKQNSAVIYDINTFAEIQSFKLDDLGNNYHRNTSTFDYSDELVMSDGLIFDVKSGKMLHKLDKFNANTNGVFHPNGREIISNSEIWDIRTFKLLSTVAGLDQCTVTFNQPSSVIYAVSSNRDSKLPDGNLNCFSTFDAFDYRSITTIDVKRPIYHLACDLDDRYIANIEGLSGVECVCRLYEVGRIKQVGDENGDESEDSEDETEDDDEVDDEDDNDDEQNIDIAFEADDDDDNDDINWISTTTDSSSDDDDTLFSLNTSMED